MNHMLIEGLADNLSDGMRKEHNHPSINVKWGPQHFTMMKQTRECKTKDRQLL